MKARIEKRLDAQFGGIGYKWKGLPKEAQRAYSKHKLWPGAWLQAGVGFRYNGINTNGNHFIVMLLPEKAVSTALRKILPPEATHFPGVFWLRAGVYERGDKKALVFKIDLGDPNYRKAQGARFRVYEACWIHGKRPLHRLFVSAFSILASLGMTREDARGSTYQLEVMPDGEMWVYIQGFKKRGWYLKGYEAFEAGESSKCPFKGKPRDLWEEGYQAAFWKKRRVMQMPQNTHDFIRGVQK